MKTPNIEEHQSIELFTKEYGNDIMSRYKKFQEEVKELDEVYHEYFDAYDKSPEVYKHLLDELSDVQGTFTHLASLMGLYQKEMLHYCMDKVIGRKTDPNYKRFSVSDKLDVVIKHDSEWDDFDKTKPNSLTAKRNSFEVTGYPVCVPVSNTENLGWIMPDPHFYYDEEHIINAWKQYYEDRDLVKMVKCNEQGIITGNDNEPE